MIIVDYFVIKQQNILNPHPLNTYFRLSWSLTSQRDHHMQLQHSNVFWLKKKIDQKIIILVNQVWNYAVDSFHLISFL